MFTLTVLGSGSSGNCALLTSACGRLLIDAGLSARQIVRRLELVGLRPEQLDGVVLTHEHGDHAMGLAVLCRQYRELPIYCSSLTAEALRHETTLAEHRNWQLFRTGADFAAADFTVQTFAVPHDAVDPAGFVFHCEGAALGFLTDLGFATKLVHERVRAATALLIETNHDSALLSADTKRPWSVKQRILSRHGHLSNDAAAAVVAQLLDAGCALRHAVLGHLSLDCNRPDLAAETMRRVGCGGSNAVEIICAGQREVGQPIRVEPARRAPAVAAPLRVAEEPAVGALQLDLFGAFA